MINLSDYRLILVKLGFVNDQDPKDTALSDELWNTLLKIRIEEEKLEWPDNDKITFNLLKSALK